VKALYVTFTLPFLQFFFLKGSVRKTSSPDRSGSKENWDLISNQASLDYPQQGTTARHNPGGRVVGRCSHA
jgi:hypothetical protein